LTGPAGRSKQAEPDSYMIDFRALRHPYRQYMARLQTSPQRPLPPPPHQQTRPNNRFCHPRQIPLPHQRRHPAPDLPAIAQPHKAPHSKRSPHACLLQRRPETQIDGNVSDIPLESWAGEAEESGQSERAEEGGRTQDRGRGSRLQRDFQQQGRRGSWRRFLTEIDMMMKAYSDRAR